VFTSLVFLLYGKTFVRGAESSQFKSRLMHASIDPFLSCHVVDWLVEIRQKKVMDKAVKSTAVVSSLFPDETVHARLFKKEMQKTKKGAWKHNDEPDQPVSITACLDGKNPNKGRPIADKFEDVTVLFADLAGFTKWSSSREPEQVFELLETLYSAFDKLALRRQVFKVETIGDW
jgi:hypothetical protein